MLLYHLSLGLTSLQVVARRATGFGRILSGGWASKWTSLATAEVQADSQYSTHVVKRNRVQDDWTMSFQATRQFLC